MVLCMASIEFVYIYICLDESRKTRKTNILKRIFIERQDSLSPKIILLV